MKCPYCHHPDTKVTDSRDASDLNAIRRRRECLDCQRRFTTFETVELSVQVHKRDGRYEEFQQQKLVRGLEAACRHTRISNDHVIALATQITSDIMQRQLQVISTSDLGVMVMKLLQERDSIAYIRYACVYRRFQNIDELVAAIQVIQPKDDAKAPV